MINTIVRHSYQFVERLSSTFHKQLLGFHWDVKVSSNFILKLKINGIAVALYYELLQLDCYQCKSKTAHNIIRSVISL